MVTLASLSDDEPAKPLKLAAVFSLSMADESIQSAFDRADGDNAWSQRSLSCDLRLLRRFFGNHQAFTIDWVSMPEPCH